MRSKTEDRLHDALDECGIPHRRNVRVGRYEVDFVVDEGLIIEVDGYHHLSRPRQRHDAIKSAYLHARGYSVHRIAASEVWVADRLESFMNEVQAQVLRPPAGRITPHLTKSQLDDLRSLRRDLAREDDGSEKEETSTHEKPRTSREIMLEYLDTQFPREDVPEGGWCCRDSS